MNQLFPIFYKFRLCGKIVLDLALSPGYNIYNPVNVINCVYLGINKISSPIEKGANPS